MELYQGLVLLLLGYIATGVTMIRIHQWRDD